MIRAFASIVSNCSRQLCFARTPLVLVAALLVFPTAHATAQLGMASAPTSLTCGAYTANQPSLRQEGTTEAAGDILISCTGPLSASQTGKQTLSLIVSGYRDHQPSAL